MVKKNKLSSILPKYIEKRIKYLVLSCFALVIISYVLLFLFQFKNYKSNLVFIGTFCLFIILVISSYRSVYIPYKQFSHLLRLFNSGHTYSHFTDLQNPFSKEFEDMDNRLSQILNSNVLMSASKRQAQYLALQNQINPHFLYNTLEGIRSEALVEGNTSISSMCEALSTFFRYTINHVRNLVPLSMELNNTNNYFFIQQYRFGDKLSLKLSFLDDCQEEALKVRIPKLTLQPIVENAIVHGLERKSGPGEVHILIEILDSRLLIIVKDNGVGMDDENLNKLRRILATKDFSQVDESNKESGGIALLNVNQRIKILFGERYGLDINSCLNLGTDITISLPIEYISKEDD